MQSEVKQVSNYKDWIDAMEIKVDYFSAFMKAWIAFNSWYESGEINGKTDKEYIENIANNTNRFKIYIMNLINADNLEGSTYRDSIANLHEALLNAAITSQEYIGVRQPISFSEVAVKNTNAYKKIEYYTYSYECTRSHGVITTSITHKNNGNSIFQFEQNEHNEDMLTSQDAFKSLAPVQKEKCLLCYRALCPYINESILDASEHAKQFGSYNFVNDVNKISRAIVIILYMLRCCLAHGDIVPDEAANKVFKYAYEVLVVPLKKLK